MATVRFAGPAAILVAVLAVTTAACGSPNAVVSSAAPSGAAARPISTWSASVWSGDPLAGRSIGWIVRQTFADTEAAPVVHVQGTVRESGKTIQLNLSMTAGHGCAGTVTSTGTGTITLISDGRNMWIKPDAAYWRARGASQATLTALDGEYLEAKPGDSGASAMANMCSIKKFLAGYTPYQASTADKETRGGTAVIDGQRALEIRDSADPTLGYVTDAAQPELLQITDPGTGGTQIDFAYPGTPPVITPPPASETIDGSEYGF